MIFTQDERLKIVQELESGQLSFREALIKYNIINSNTLRSWLLKYGSHPNSILKSKITQADRRKAAYQVIYKEASPAEVAAQMGVGLFSVWGWARKYRNEVNQNDSLTKETPRSVQQSEQKNEIENLKLKVAALEMMIDIAEKELHIDIRKKSGTKQ